MNREIKVNQIYKHFKGNLYKVLNIAKHTETEELVVVYKRVEDDLKDIYVRPLEMFMSKVDKKKYPDVEQEYRMELVADVVNVEDMNSLTQKIQMWSINRNMHHSKNPSRQFLKVVEEVGELAQGMAKDKEEQILDSFGDVYVTLLVLAQQLNVDFIQSVQLAYNEIKDRRGKLIDGVFVKEEDLK